MYLYTARLDEALEFPNFTDSNSAQYNYPIRDGGLTITLCVQAGRVILYASFFVPNPNRALNSFVLDAISHQQKCEDVYVPNNSVNQESNRRKRQVLGSIERILYVSIEGVASTSHLQLKLTLEILHNVSVQILYYTTVFR